MGIKEEVFKEIAYKAKTFNPGTVIDLTLKKVNEEIDKCKIHEWEGYKGHIDVEELKKRLGVGG